MAITNHERVGKAMDLLKQGLGPFVEREFSQLFTKTRPVPRPPATWGKIAYWPRRPSANGTRQAY